MMSEKKETLQAGFLSYEHAQLTFFNDSSQYFLDFSLPHAFIAPGPLFLSSLFSLSLFVDFFSICEAITFCIFLQKQTQLLWIFTKLKLSTHKAKFMMQEMEIKKNELYYANLPRGGRVYLPRKLVFEIQAYDLGSNTDLWHRCTIAETGESWDIFT